jgi:pyrophosphatase PpaX
MTYDLVLFDLDGTIADTELVLVRTMLFFIEQLTPTRKVTLHELLKLSGPPLDQSLASYFPNEDIPALVKAFAAKAREYYPRYAKAFPGIHDVLTVLKSRGVQVGIVTSKLRINALLTLEVIGLKDQFPLLITLDEVKHAKPDPEGILFALSHFHVAAHKTLFVGDTLYDYLAGQRAKVDTALVTWSFKSFAKDVTPTYWLNDFLALKEIVHE